MAGDFDDHTGAGLGSHGGGGADEQEDEPLLREELDGEFVDTSREGFRIAHDISAFSLTALAKRVVPLMGESGSIITLSYLGGERVVPNYNVMGVAKAALEMSVRYLAVTLGQRGFASMRSPQVRSKPWRRRPNILM